MGHHHDHAHSAGHGHSHAGHSHTVENYNRAFALGIGLNVAFVLIEATYGFLADSLALLADAGHNLSDVASLLLAWGASVLATKAATDKRTYGFRKATVMASLVSAVLLLMALGGITVEAIGRFMNPAPVQGMTVIVVGAIGVLINTATALLFFKGQSSDLNIRAAFLHMAADAGVSLGVVIAGVLVMWQGWLWVDPVVSVLIVLVIFYGTWGLLKESMNYAMDSVPDHINLAHVREYLLGVESVKSIHDLHVWPLSTTEVALTVHLSVTDAQLSNRLLSDIQQHLKAHFKIQHSTIQVECSELENSCALQTCQLTQAHEHVHQ